MDVFVVPKACPICQGDVAGNDKALYFCKRCNILFARHSLLGKR
jgi:hypothetical protein